MKLRIRLSNYFVDISSKLSKNAKALSLDYENIDLFKEDYYFLSWKFDRKLLKSYVKC